MEFFPVRCSNEAYAEYIHLFKECFPNADKFNLAYLDWLYHCNPDGQVLGFDARDGDRLVAHYACIPARAQIDGLEVKVLLSLNTATHPKHQGKGLFVKLAEMTYSAAADQGFDCVYGVANASSTPGFTRKLMFQLVGPLTAKAGFGSMRIDRLNEQATPFQRVWSKQALEWRCSNPANPILSRTTNNKTTFLAPALVGGLCMVTAQLENVTTSRLKKGYASPLRLFIGIIPSAWKEQSLFIDIPDKLRPSPLNLIYRSLSGRVKTIDIENIFISFLDFDAY